MTSIPPLLRGWVNLRSERFHSWPSPGSHAYPMPMEAPKEERGTGTAHNSTYVLGALDGASGSSALRRASSTTWPLALVGLGATSHTCHTLYAIALSFYLMHDIIVDAKT